MRKATNPHVTITGAFIERYIEEGVGPRNVQQFLRDLQHATAAYTHHIVYSVCFFLPLYESLAPGVGTQQQA